MQFAMNKTMLGLLALTVVASTAPTIAFALTAEVAKKCSALTAQAYPPRVPGNPAAGSAAGSYSDQRAYFNKCVADADTNKADGGSAASQRPAAGSSPSK
jgi:hypothetical protein